MSQWEAIARNYEEERNEASLPAVLVDDLLVRLAKALTPGSMLDFGAGIGTLAEKFHDMGWQVSAYEPNAPMRDVMIRHFSAKGRAIDVLSTEPEVAKLAAQKLVLCVNVFDHLADVPAVLRLFRDLLEPAGRLLLCIPHPLKNHGHWVKERDTDSVAWRYSYYRIDDYLLEGEVRRNRENVNGDVIITSVVSQHRTMSTYYNWVRDAGFSVDRMYEPGPQPEVEQQFPAYYLQSSRIPYFWILDCSPYAMERKYDGR
jgi:SAM-dependent methyltransferase